MLRVSGAVLLDQHRVLIDVLGKEKLAACIASLPPTFREQYESLLSVSWCPTEVSQALLAAVAAAAGETVRAMQRKLVRKGLERTVATVWRPLLRITSDEALLKRTPILYSHAFDKGDLSVTFAVGRADFLLTGVPQITQLDLDGLAFGIEAVLDMAGRRDTTVESSRSPEGARLLATWIPKG